MSLRAAVLVCAGLLPLVQCGGGPAELGVGVTLLPLPAGGRLPRAAVDAGGAVHVVYFQGEPRAGDLLHVTRAPGAEDWSEPRYVNSDPGSVVGIGPIDGGQLALGRDGRLHVVWFKLGRTEFLYTRTDDAGTGFEPQFALASGEGVEAGPSIAADRRGNLYVFWHTGGPPDAERSVFMTVSRDDGRTFSAARPVNGEAEGACDCCGLQAMTDEAGAVFVSYRGAGENVRRGQRLLTSRDRGATFSDELLDPWEINACPISTTSLARGPAGMVVSWETAGQVFAAAAGGKPRQAASPAGAAAARRKNPAVAVNHRGETLLGWGDGFGWRSGGTFRWQLFDADGAPLGGPGTGPEIPEGSLAAVVAEPDGTFLVTF